MNNSQALVAAPFSGSDFEAMVLRHLPQVGILARRIAAKLPHHVELDDLISAGVLGLIDAIRRYDQARDASLATFAQFRIRGAILDSLRADDWGSRALRQMARRIAAARQTLMPSLGRAPSEAELAAHLGLALPDYHEQVTRIHGLQLANFVPQDEEDDRGRSVDQVPSEDPTPLQRLLAHEQEHSVRVAMEGLPLRERQVVVGYYVEELTMREIGNRLGVTESRVCQLHARALARLKRSLSRSASACGQYSSALPCPRSRVAQGRSATAGSLPDVPIRLERGTHPAVSAPALQ